MKNPFSSKYILCSYFTKHKVMTLFFQMAHYTFFKNQFLMSRILMYMTFARLLGQTTARENSKPLGPLYKGHKREKKKTKKQ